MLELMQSAGVWPWLGHLRWTHRNGALRFRAAARIAHDRGPVEAWGAVLELQRTLSSVRGSTQESLLANAWDRLSQARIPDDLTLLMAAEADMATPLVSGCGLAGLWVLKDQAWKSVSGLPARTGVPTRPTEPLLLGGERVVGLCNGEPWQEPL